MTVTRKTYISSTANNTDQVQRGDTLVYWAALANNHATLGTSINIYDATSGTTGNTFQKTIPPVSIRHHVFDPPIQLTEGLRVALGATGTPFVCLGYE